MKKAYVKPVFLAEEFVAAASVAACKYNPGSAVNETLSLEFLWPEGVKKPPVLCAKGDAGHDVYGGELFDGNGQNHYKTELLGDYAYKEDNTATLFDTSNRACDFVWMQPSGNGNEIKVWGDGEDTPSLVANHSSRDTSKLFYWNGIQNFLQFFAGDAADNQNHSINYTLFSFNS